MNDYNEMRALYEGYIGNSYNPGPNGQYSPAEAPSGYSYKKGHLPVGHDSSGGGRGFDAGQTGQGIATINSDEEISTVNKSDIISKIDALIDQCNTDGSDYTMYQLISLKEYVNDL